MRGIIRQLKPIAFARREEELVEEWLAVVHRYDIFEASARGATSRVQELLARLDGAGTRAP